MTCRAPLFGVRKEGSGDKPIVFGSKPETLADAYELLELPCGRCMGCRLKTIYEWGARCAHEAQYQWEFNDMPSSFITLTYDDAHLPIDGSLVPEHLQNFHKSLRRRIEPHKYRHYSCGEYGSQCIKHQIKDCPSCGSIQRPHYHALIFGWAFPDRHQCGDRDGLPVYESQLLNEVWEKGLHEIGSVTFESATYVAGYVTKKIVGKDSHEHYTRYCPLRDNWYNVEPEFHHMSTKPGLGIGWLAQYLDDVYPADECPVPGRGILGKPPKYYDSLAEKWGVDMDSIRAKRRQEMAQSLLEGPSLISRALSQDAEIARLQRNL